MKSSQQISQTPVRKETAANSLLLQRKCACGGSAGLTGQCEECSRKNLLQRRATDNAATPDVPRVVHEVLNTPGQPLDAVVRTFMESRFDQDFSRIRVHTDERAAESAQAVNALAYTVGRDIVFGTAQYRPGTDEGKRLLAHELTHSLQQGSVPGSQAPRPGISDSADPAEHQADHSADAVMAGHTVGAVLRVPPRIHRQPPQTRFTEGQLVVTTLQVNWLTDLHGEPGAKPAPPLKKGTLLRLGAPHPKGAGQAFYATVMKNRDEPNPALVGVVNINWIRPETTQETTYEQKLREASKLLAAGTGFQRCDVKLVDVSTEPKFDSEYWEKVENPDPEKNELRLKKKPAHEAIDKIFEHPEKWTFDCAQFVQVMQLYAQRHLLGNDAFDKKMSTIIIRPHLSEGVETEEVYTVAGAITASGAPVKALDPKLVDDAPVGSRIMWTNLSGTGTSRNENAIKVGKDKYVAKGLGKKVEFSRKELEEALSQLTDPPGEVIIAEVEIYKRPTVP